MLYVASEKVSDFDTTKKSCMAVRRYLSQS